MLALLLSLNNKLVAYNFLNDSGLNTTAQKSGEANASVFSGSLTSGIGVVVYALLSLIGIVFLGLTIYGGMIWITAEGKEERIEKAKKIIVNGFIGLVVVFAAYAISYFAISALANK
jgi:Type IV secretion system pilin